MTPSLADINNGADSEKISPAKIEEDLEAGLNVFDAAQHAGVFDGAAGHHESLGHDPGLPRDELTGHERSAVVQSERPRLAPN